LRLRVSPIPRSTPLGRRAGLVGIGLLAAGFNTGNNLFYLFFSVMAATELVGFLAAGQALRRAELEVALPRRGRQGSPMRATIRLTNRSRWLPLPALRFRVFARSGEEAEVVTPALAPGAIGSGVGPLMASRRGWFELDRIELRTDFPFGLSARVARGQTSVTRVLVLPRALAGPSANSPRREGATRSSVSTNHPGEEPMDAREYRAGDDARRIDWKATARTARLIWRQRRGTPPASTSVRLDRSGPSGATFETRVSRAAGASVSALARGMAVGFESDECVMEPRSGASQRRKILEYLALVRAVGDRTRA